MKSKEREIHELADIIRRRNIRIIGITKGEEKEQGIESIFRQKVGENFPNLKNKLELEFKKSTECPIMSTQKGLH